MNEGSAERSGAALPFESYVDPTYSPGVFYRQLPLLVAFSDRVFVYRLFEPHLASAGLESNDVLQAVDAGFIIPVFRHRWFNEAYRMGHRESAYHRKLSAFDRWLRDHSSTIILDDAFFSQGDEVASKLTSGNTQLIDGLLELLHTAPCLQVTYREDLDRLPGDEVVRRMVRNFANDAFFLLQRARRAVPYVRPEWTDAYQRVVQTIGRVGLAEPAMQHPSDRDSRPRRVVARLVEKETGRIDLQTASAFRSAGLHRSLANWLAMSLDDLACGEDGSHYEQEVAARWERAKAEALDISKRYADRAALAAAVVSSVLAASVGFLDMRFAAALGAALAPLLVKLGRDKSHRVGSWFLRRKDPHSLAWLYFFLEQGTGEVSG